jgi:hypothetical protein
MVYTADSKSAAERRVGSSPTRGIFVERIDMSALVSIIYGVPLNKTVSKKLDEWEIARDDRWFVNGANTCGFDTLYSASGNYYVGYCGVELDELDAHTPELLSNLITTPTEGQKKAAEELVAALDPELRALAGPIGVYTIWHDS